jgi:clan AA aspartic protease
MAHVHAEIEIINGGDIELARRGYIDKDEIKRMWIAVLVDSGSFMLAINQNIREQLQLPVVEKRKALLADDTIVECEVVAPVEIRFKNRRSTCSAFVLPGNAEPLLGAILMEDMDVLIHPLLILYR